jgi:hypothetical protein
MTLTIDAGCGLVDQNFGGESKDMEKTIRDGKLMERAIV